MIPREDEPAILAQYEDLIWRLVHQFRNRAAKDWIEADDLHQEAVIAFIQYIRTIDSPEALQKAFPFRQITNAMCVHCIERQTLSMPKRTSAWKQIMAAAQAPVPLDNIEVEAACALRPIDESDDRLTFDAFIGGLPDRERTVLQMRIAGMSNRDIAKKLHMTDSER